MPRKILICTILRRKGPTGVQTHISEYSRWLEAAGMPVSFLSPLAANPVAIYPIFGLRRIISRFNREAAVWWYRHWHGYFLERQLRVELKNTGACVVYAQCPVSAAAALKVRSSQAQRVVMVVHFNVSQAEEWVAKGEVRSGSLLYKSMVDLEREVFSALDGVVYVSRYMADAISARIPEARHVPSCIVPNFLAQGSASSVLGDERRTDLILIGTLEPRKNQLYALQIMAEAKAMGAGLTLTIVGDGPDRSLLEAAVVELGLEDVITFTGQVSGAAELISNHAALLHVAKLENMPLVLIEALAARRPLFAPAVGGIPEVFSDGVEGAYIPLDDARKAASIISSFLLSPTRVQEASQAAHFRYRAAFTAEANGESLTRFLCGTTSI